jgi:four helix bundle protein
MAAKYFEDLEIWQIAQENTKILSKIFYDKNFKNYSFQDQIMRASISVSNNIAE